MLLVENHQKTNQKLFLLLKHLKQCLRIINNSSFLKMWVYQEMKLNLCRNHQQLVNKSQLQLNLNTTTVLHQNLKTRLFNRHNQGGKMLQQSNLINQIKSKMDKYLPKNLSNSPKCLTLLPQLLLQVALLMRISHLLETILPL